MTLFKETNRFCLLINMINCTKINLTYKFKCLSKKSTFLSRGNCVKFMFDCILILAIINLIEGI